MGITRELRLMSSAKAKGLVVLLHSERGEIDEKRRPNSITAKLNIASLHGHFKLWEKT